MIPFLYKYKTVIFSAFVIISVAVLHRWSIFLPPTSVHAWAQNDWLALSYGFIDNGMDFFHPQVNQLNLQFPSKIPLETPQGTTAVDFPINPYTVAALMKLFHTQTPMVYRAYTLILSFIGIIFLFKAVKLQTSSFSTSLLITSFVLFQPTYQYYMDGFLPTQNALSVFFIGLYFLVRFYKMKDNINLIPATLFFTLAGLMRLPYSIPLIALLMTFAIGFVRKQNKWSLMLTPLFGLIIIGAYFIYNHQLANTYGSVFLNHILPVKNLAQVIQYIIIGPLKNLRNVLPLPHLFMLAVIIMLSVRKLRSTNKTKLTTPAAIFVGLTILGGLGYALLLSRQLYAHDYYYNDFLMPGLVILLTALLSLEIYPPGAIRNTFVLFFVFASLNTSFEAQSMKYTPYFGPHTGILASHTFEDAYTFLNDNNVDKNATLLVINALSPSMPGNITRRKCFTIRDIETEADKLKDAMQFPFDYILVPTFSLSTLEKEYPNWKEETTCIAEAEKLALFILK